MHTRIRHHFWLVLIFASMACSMAVPSLKPDPTGALMAKATLQKVSITPTTTLTPIPSPTSTPTAAPSLTPSPTPQNTPTQAPTAIPLGIQLSIFDDLWSIVNDTYVYPDFNGLDWEAIRTEYEQKINAGLSNQDFYLAMSELIYSLGDDHSFFLDPQQVAEQEAEYQGKHEYVGIGVLVSAVPERNHGVILSVFPGSPAEGAGLKPRDSIISVDGTPILDDNGFLRDIVRGPEGTTITLRVQTPGEEPRDLQITRHRISGGIPLSTSVIATPEGKRIGYILLVTFDDKTVDDQVEAALQQMTADAPLDGLILDNRMNNGGSSEVLEPMLSFFTRGKLGTFVNRNDERPLFITRHDVNGSLTLPLVVLVGSGTASFGEIFAGVLQDTGRAYLIGKTTDGNVEILWGYDLEDGSQVWLANETFRPVNHPDADWEKTGIIPDLTVAGDFDEFSLENDPAVAAAIQHLVGP